MLRVNNDHTFHFHYALWFDTNVLAYMIDSLVRVSRRDEEGDFVVVEFQRLNLQTLKFNHNLTRQVNHEVHFMAHSTHYHSTSALNLTTISSTISLFFKVLFIFPSRYLFAIGLLTLFSLWWCLPPTSSCNPKQLDSTNYHSQHDSILHRVITFHDLTFQSNSVLHHFHGSLHTTTHYKNDLGLGFSHFTRRY